MGKRIISQRRGRGTSTYRKPAHRFKGEAKHKKILDKEISGEVIDFVHCPAHSGPLAKIKYKDGEVCLTPAVENQTVGDIVTIGGSDYGNGNVMRLRDIPEGAFISNIELSPGDGGKFVRASGNFAKIITKMDDKIIVELPSKKRKTFLPMCRATIGVIAGGGRHEKPFLKAGRKYFHMKAKNKLWPQVSGSAMNAVDHPFGNARTSRKSKAKPMSKNAPPGRKVGMVGARRTGRKKR